MDNGLLAAFCWGLGCLGREQNKKKKKDTSIRWAGLAGYVPWALHTYGPSCVLSLITRFMFGRAQHPS